jgi:hypothetical protein
MNTCNHCDVELTQDNWRYMGRKRPAYTCLVCDREQANKRKSAVREHVARYKMSKGCETCGFNSHHAPLQLAHINREDKVHKYSTNRSAYNQNWSIKRVNEEFTKCRVLCANCHSIETVRENGWKEYE